MGRKQDIVKKYLKGEVNRKFQILRTKRGVRDNICVSGCSSWRNDAVTCRCWKYLTLENSPLDLAMWKPLVILSKIYRVARVENLVGVDSRGWKKRNLN